MAKKTEKELQVQEESTVDSLAGDLSAEEFYFKKEAELKEKEAQLNEREQSLDDREKALSEKENQKVKTQEPKPKTPRVFFIFEGITYQFVEDAPQKIRIDGKVKTQKEIADNEDDILQLVATGSGLIEKAD